MGDFIFTRVLRSKFLRRSSTSSAQSAKDLPPSPGRTVGHPENTATSGLDPSNSNRPYSSAPSTPDLRGRRASSARSSAVLERSSSPRTKRLSKTAKSRPPSEQTSLDGTRTPLEGSIHKLSDAAPEKECPQLTVQEPTPDVPILTPLNKKREVNVIEEEFEDAVEDLKQDPESGSRPTSARSQKPFQLQQRPPLADRKQSLVPAGQQRLIHSLLQSDRAQGHVLPQELLNSILPPLNAGMVHRKIWVKRPGQSATLVQVTEEDVVDDVRDAILRKYGNSLGRSLDAPDITLKIISRDQPGRTGPAERILGPEEQICRTLDTYYPGSQTVDEALIIETPARRTPKPSPRYGYSMPHYMVEEPRIGEDSGYFPPMPVIPSPHTAASNHSGSVHHQQVHAMSVLTTGQIPPLPSPGSRTYRHHAPGHGARPKYGRNHTSSPTVLTSVPPNQQIIDPTKQLTNGVNAPVPPPLPTPPAPGTEHISITPPARVASPRPTQKVKKSKKKDATKDAAPSGGLYAGLLDGTVPPINVLIVEDNVINLRLLEAFMRRLQVRWKTAVNGREAVNKWRAGGFHLVLMDIQLPIMSGLEATREIRRLERVNNIGVFSSSITPSTTSRSLEEKAEAAGEKMENGKYKPQGDDILEQRELFKSPVIVVALTASSLQSDRHEALAAGCNDFLTKPVNFVWLERKVMEWGCMQALIDFDGWRKWKDFTSSSMTTGAHESSTATKTTSSGGPNGSATPAKTKRKPMSIRRKKDTSEQPEKSTPAPIPEQHEDEGSREESPMGSHRKNNSTGITNGDKVKSDSGSGAASTREPSSSDASAGSGAAATSETQAGDHLKVPA